MDHFTADCGYCVGVYSVGLLISEQAQDFTSKSWWAGQWSGDSL